MLEHQALWLGSWSLAPPPAGSATVSLPWRAILDARTRISVGLARQQVKPAFVWFGGLAVPTIEIFEGEDEALVFTLERLWSLKPSWRVRDSEGNTVGTIRGSYLADGQGRALASAEHLTGTSDYRWRAEDGRELGTVCHAEDGPTVTWDPSVYEFPFTKMVLLASVICGKTQ